MSKKFTHGLRSEAMARADQGCRPSFRFDAAFVDSPSGSCTETKAKKVELLLADDRFHFAHKLLSFGVRQRC